jgi:hypothetical protein
MVVSSFGRSVASDRSWTHAGRLVRTRSYVPMITFEQALERAKGAVIRVGASGRGFIVSAGEDKRYVITAAHCLPRSRLPSPHLANSGRELTFSNFLGPLGQKQRTIWAELCAINLCDDFAVLGAPDGQALYEQCAEYEKFTEAPTMTIGIPPDALAPYLWKNDPGRAAWMLSLDGEWQRCVVYNGGRFLTLMTDQKIESGMSGSPIIDDKGAAIGVISTASDGGDFNFNLGPSLTDCSPAHLLRKLRPRVRACCEVARRHNVRHRGAFEARRRPAAGLVRRRRATSRDQAWLQRPCRRSYRASASALVAAICCASAIS